MPMIGDRVIGPSAPRNHGFLGRFDPEGYTQAMEGFASARSWPGPWLRPSSAWAPGVP
jgi:hypothetical protein